MRWLNPLAAWIVFTLFLVSFGQSPQQVAQLAFGSTLTVLVYDEFGQPLGLGSGFVVAPGLVVTNAHVVVGASDVLVRPIGDAVPARVTVIEQFDEVVDLAVLRVDDLALPPLTIASDAVASVGDTVFAVGSPLGLEGTFSQGIVSGYRTVSGASLIQITAPISPGSSGGPVLDTEGRVVGVAVGTYSSGQNLNFAVPVATLADVMARPAEARPVSELPAQRNAAEAVEEPGLVGAVRGEALVIGAGGSYSFSLRNLLPRSVKDVEVLVVFYGPEGYPVDTDSIRFRGPILAGLAQRVSSRMEQGVRTLVTGSTTGSTVRTRVELRIISFAFSD